MPPVSFLLDGIPISLHFISPVSTALFRPLVTDKSGFIADQFARYSSRTFLFCSIYRALSLTSFTSAMNTGTHCRLTSKFGSRQPLPRFLINRNFDESGRSAPPLYP